MKKTYRILVQIGKHWYIWQEGLAQWQVEIMVPVPQAGIRIEAKVNNSIPA